MVCLAFRKNGFNFVTQKLTKTEKCYFQTLITFVFDLLVASKPFENASYDQLLIQTVLDALSHFISKLFQVCHSKACKKVKMLFLNAQNVPYERKVSIKPFSKMQILKPNRLVQWISFFYNVSHVYKKTLAPSGFVFLYVVVYVTIIINYIANITSKAKLI